MPVIVSKVKDGSLVLSAVDQDTNAIAEADIATVSCQVTNCRIEPSAEGSSTSDQQATLGGCLLPTDAADTEADRLVGTAVSDHNVSSGVTTGDLLVPFTWRNRNKKIHWEFIPRTDPSSESDGGYTATKMEFSGLAICTAMIIGGEVDAQIDLDFDFDIVEGTLELPERYQPLSGGGFAAKATKSVKTD